MIAQQVFFQDLLKNHWTKECLLNVLIGKNDILVGFGKICLLYLVKDQL